MKFLILLCAAIPIVLGTGNTVHPTPPPGDLLECTDDANGHVMIVPLDTSAGPGEVYTPLATTWPFPSSNTLSPSNIASIISQLNIDVNLQQLNQPNFSDPPLSFPFRYELNRFPDYAALQRICGNDVLANFTQTNSSQRNADQGTFWDITNTLESNWLEIWNSLDQTQYPDVSSVSWSGDIIGLFREMMEVLSCRVAFKWADSGITYIPRYYRGGFCLNRKCSLPDHNDFRCHAELSHSESRLLEAARWDCCNADDGQGNVVFQCGFRKVKFPVVCDCDCRCLSQANTI